MKKQKAIRLYKWVVPDSKLGGGGEKEIISNFLKAMEKCNLLSIISE